LVIGTTVIMQLQIVGLSGSRFVHGNVRNGLGGEVCGA
jgi:hypothetical protein